MTTLYMQMPENGKLPDGIRSTLATLLPRYAGKKINITIAETKDTSSDKQRRYYFSVIVPAFQKYFETQGQHYSKDNMHDAMMRSIGGFSNPFVNPFTGLPDDGRLSYNDLTKAQTEGYHTLCLKWGAEHGFQIPLPNEEQYGYATPEYLNSMEDRN